MLGIVVLFFAFVGLLLAVIGFSKKDKKSQYGDMSARRVFGWIGLIVMVVMLICIAPLGLKIIDAGEVGVQVKFGRVLDNTLTEGFNKKSIFADVYTYSIRIREYTMSSDVGEGDQSAPDSVSARTADNSEVKIDATLWWAIDPESAFDIYKKVSKNDDSLQGMIVRPAIRTAIRDEAASYTLETLMRERGAMTKGITDAVITNVAGKGILIDRVLVRRVEPPQSVDEAIQKKLKAEQELQQKEFELAKAKKDAEIRITEARGVAEAQDIIQKKLTPIYVQYEAIQAYKTLAGSNNTTFVILPTSTEGAGMPLILNTK